MLEPEPKGVQEYAVFAREFDSDPDNLALVLPEIDDFLEQVGIVGADVFAVRLALEEALINALKHGNLRDEDINGNAQRAIEEKDTALAQAMLIRRCELMVQKVTLEIHCATMDTQVIPIEGRHGVRMVAKDGLVECLITDEGMGIDEESIPDPTSAANRERPSGRGLHLIQHYMNDVELPNGPGKVLKMVRLMTRTNKDVAG
jgi:serine/threonine-protein kinase RsbW